MIITSTGYYHTGSSAVFDLLREYKSNSEGVFKDIRSEHILLYMPNGLFDLEDKLLVGNNIHRSDEAIESFRNQMIKLYKNNFIWFGNYKKLFGERFLDSVDCFIDQIVDFRVNGIWYNDYCDNQFSLPRTMKNLVRVLLGQTINGDFSKKLVLKDKQCIEYSFCDSTKFYQSAQKFIQDFLHYSTNEPNKNLLLDHFLLPHNLYRIPKYFQDDFRVFVVDRDPRDVYIEMMNDHNNLQKCIPSNIDDYIVFWKKLRETESVINDSRICRLYFEDLIYDYENTVNKIEDFCMLKKVDHIYPQSHYKTEIGLKNSKLYLKNNGYTQEVKKIERELSQYLYNFPEDYVVPTVDKTRFGIVI